jgi:hypothetical protein
MTTDTIGHRDAALQTLAHELAQGATPRSASMDFGTQSALRGETPEVPSSPCANSAKDAVGALVLARDATRTKVSTIPCQNSTAANKRLESDSDAN